ncbi:uncharacterized protein [Miscanthus floridulus]|uniref:uncharacterized protein n=1 Tax=Miscanthus floridulus TaxID=154761 RepID=UPI0034585B3E
MVQETLPDSIKCSSFSDKPQCHPEMFQLPAPRSHSIPSITYSVHIMRLTHTDQPPRLLFLKVAYLQTKFDSLFLLMQSCHWMLPGAHATYFRIRQFGNKPFCYKSSVSTLCLVYEATQNSSYLQLTYSADVWMSLRANSPNMEALKTLLLSSASYHNLQKYNVRPGRLSTTLLYFTWSCFQFSRMCLCNYS